MITYSEADDSVHVMVREAMTKYHQDIAPLNLRVGVLMAHSVDKDGMDNGKPPLKNAGFPAGAKIKVVALKDRVYKNTDVEIIIDGAMWEKLTEAQRLATLDHELEHIMPPEELKFDDLGRPKIKLRPDTFYLWGFESIARRHGVNSPEVMGAQQLMEECGDVLFLDREEALASLPPTKRSQLATT